MASKKHRLLFKRFCICFLMLLAPVAVLHAADNSKRKTTPIHIQAARLDSYNEQKKIIFSGDVVAKKAEITIYADQMTVFYRKVEDKEGRSGENTEQVEKIFAKGQVKITKGKHIATGNEAVYYEAEQYVILTGNPRVWYGTSMVKGDKITVFLAEDRSIVESQPGRRIEAVVYPE